MCAFAGKFLELHLRLEIDYAHGPGTHPYPPACGYVARFGATKLIQRTYAIAGASD
jgi:hypothetical protein